MQANCDGVVEVVGVAEAVPDEEEFVGAGAIGVEELAVGCDWRTCGHCEVGALLEAPLLLVLGLLLGGFDHLDGNSAT